MGCLELDKDQALFAINGHLGETVSVELCAFDQQHGYVSGTVLVVQGELQRMYSLDCMSGMSAWERDMSEAIYTVGDQVIDLGMAPGFIEWREDGINFHLATGVLLAWTWTETD